MNFLIENAHTVLEIRFNDTEEALNELIDDGFLDDEFDVDAYFNDELDETEALNLISDAIVDYLGEFVEKKEEEGSDEEFIAETDELVKYAYVIDENTYFNQFLEGYLFENK